MASCPRGDVVAKGEVAVYHCWNRCVRRARLCGVDPLTGQDYEYRRRDIQQLEQLLAGLFAVEIAFHAEMANHLHLVVRTRPDVAQKWSDKEVVRRWLTITKLKRNGTLAMVDPTEEEEATELKKPGRVECLRNRLSDVSWFMGTLGENTSRRCNGEDNCKGTFWEDRFQCRDLADEAAVLVCGLYVDLNQIRAGEALTPEQSTHTSAYNRIQALQQRMAQAKQGQSSNGPRNPPAPDAWLCPLTLQEASDDQREPVVLRERPGRASEKGLLPISLEKYLELLDWTGRMVRADKPGAIPANLAPILQRLGIQTQSWTDAIKSFDRWFGLVVGSSEAVRKAAQRAGRRWFRGQRRCAETFG